MKSIRGWEAIVSIFNIKNLSIKLFIIKKMLFYKSCRAKNKCVLKKSMQQKKKYYNNIDTLYLNTILNGWILCDLKWKSRVNL